MKKSWWKLIVPAAKDAFTGFSDHKVTKLSASLAYYTVFSMGPLLVVIIFLSSIFLGQEAVQGTIYHQLESFIGKDAALQIQEIIKNAAISGKGGIAAIIGVITLLIGATTVFGELQDSMNSIWGVKAKPKAGIMKLIGTRLLSFGMVASLGFLLLVSLAITAVVESIGGRLTAMFPDTAVVLIYAINLLLTLVVTTVLFGIIFKVLPDVQLKWKDVWPGAIATSLLFLIGKFLISLYISKSDVGSTYGSAGSLVIILLWIYYSAIILYFGAEFTKAFALQKGAEIKPAKLAEWDEKPPVAGAKIGADLANENKSAQPAESNEHRTKRVLPPAPKILPSINNAGANYESRAEKKSGFGTMLLGLALYFINSKKDKK